MTTLRQIALLRKADFSLEEIKQLQSGGDGARETLQQYLQQKERDVEIAQRIIEALRAIPKDQVPKMGDICSRIEGSLQEAPVPVSDLKPKTSEVAELWIFRIIGLLFSGVLASLCVHIISEYRREFPFPKLDIGFINIIGLLYLLIPLICSIVVLYLYRKPRYWIIEKRSRRNASLFRVSNE